MWNCNNYTVSCFLGVMLKELSCFDYNTTKSKALITIFTFNYPIKPENSGLLENTEELQDLSQIISHFFHFSILQVHKLLK